MRGSSVCGALLLALLGGCTMIPHYHKPEAPVADGWPQGKGKGVAGQDASALLQDWRSFYRDPVMQTLIASALENNRDLRIAQQQAAAASSQFDIENAALFPTLNGTAGVNIQKMNSHIWSLSQTNEPIYMRQYAVGFGVSAYEVDLWGRIRSASRASFDHYMASALNQQAMRLSIISSVATAMLNWVANTQALALTQAVLANRQHTYDLVRQTADIGTGTQLDVAEAESALHDVETNVEIYTRQKAEAFNQLTLLVGMPLSDAIVQSLNTRASLDSVSAFPDVPAGLPSEMIARRPDIRAAEAELRAANDDIGAARAEFFPKIQITAANGTASNNITRLFQSGMGAWNVAPQITVPLFDAGRLMAQLKQAHSRKREEIARYEKAIQQSFREVADALIGRETYVRQTTAQQNAVAANKRQYALALQRYKAGYDPYLETLVAQRALYTAQLSAITTQLQALSNRVTLYKTLGGGWGQIIWPPKTRLADHIL